jgi:predicted dehydrogenase
MKNVCIVGYGAIGPVHAKALEMVENAKLYAVCEIDGEKRKKCRSTYDVKEYTDFDEMLLDPEIDSVHICTPHYLHFEMIRKAMMAGKSVVTEKPVTMTKEEYDALLKLDESGKVCVVLQNRLNPCVQRLKELVESRELGAVKAVRAVLTWHRDEAYYASGSWRGKWETEGGCLLINQAIHTLDLFHYVVGDILSVKTNMFNYSLESVIEAEDTLVAYLGFADKVKGIFFATNAYGDNSAPLFEIVFEKGVARYMDKQLWIDGQIRAEDVQASVGKDYWGSGHGRLIKLFYDEQKYFTVFDAKNTMETVFEMYRQARPALCAD